VYELIERPMTPDERRRLLDCMPLAPSPFRARPFKLRIAAELVGVLLAVIILVWRHIVPASMGVPAAVGCYALLWLFQLNERVLQPLRRHRKANRKVWGFRKVLDEATTVRVQRVASARVVQITGDESTVCLFDVGENLTYWIDPYFMLPGRPPKEWPNSRFEVVRIPGWEEELGPFCDGERLRPLEVTESRDCCFQEVFEVPKDGLIRQSLDAFLRTARGGNTTGSSRSTR